MTNRATIQELGGFADGAIPPPFEHTFLDHDGVPVDISTFTVFAMNITSDPVVGGPLGDGNIDFTTDGIDGKVTYEWSATDMASPGRYRAQMWVSNATTQKYESDLITYLVYDGPGSAP